MNSKKIDLYELHKDEYITPKTPELVETRASKYLTITGRGEPGGEEFTRRLGALYNAVFTTKMAQKFSGNDYKVCKLEGLWWGDKAGRSFLLEPRNKWNWKLLIRTPDFITGEHLSESVSNLRKKGKSVEVNDVKLETIHERLCVQVLHVGSYADEGKTIAMMKAFTQEKGLSFHGLHHEIYLSDPRRVAAERLKTILRNPVH